MTNPQDDELVQRIRMDLLDSFDEELEMEVEDRAFSTDPATNATDESRAARAHYFRELFRLQGELVKLQDWVVASGHKVVVLFEGRDAAGKGGAIKRITQRLNPRVARVAALPRLTTANAPSGISSAMYRTCPQPGRWSCLTAAGTTAPGWNA